MYKADNLILTEAKRRVFKSDLRNLLKNRFSSGSFFISLRLDSTVYSSSIHNPNFISTTLSTKLLTG